MKRAVAAIAWVALAVVAAEAPEGWQRLKINDKKKPTLYEAQTDSGRPIIHARAQASASGLYRKAGFELAERPTMRWSWKVGGLIPGADSSNARREDSPVRIVLASPHTPHPDDRGLQRVRGGRRVAGDLA